MAPLTAPTAPGRLAFTCVVPVHAGDDPAHFRAAMDSIAASSLRPAQVLIAQDGDLPAPLAALVEDCRARGARVTRSPGPKGLQHNLNHAMSQITTPWIARADADDINRRDRFAQQTRFLEENPTIAVLGGGIVEFWPDGRSRAKMMPLTHEAIVRWARWRNPINHMTAFVRADAFAACGGYPDLTIKEDYGLWLGMIQRGYLLANLATPLVEARLGADFYRRRSGARNLSSELGLFRIKRRIRRIGWWRAWLAMIARAAILTAAGPSRLVYERILRR